MCWEEEGKTCQNADFHMWVRSVSNSQESSDETDIFSNDTDSDPWPVELCPDIAKSSASGRRSRYSYFFRGWTMQIDRTDESPCAPSTCEIYKILYSKCTRVVGNGNQSDSKVFLDFVTDKKPAVGDKLDERLYLTNNSWFCGFAAVTLNPSGTTKCDRTGATLLTRKAELYVYSNSKLERGFLISILFLTCF